MLRDDVRQVSNTHQVVDTRTHCQPYPLSLLEPLTTMEMRFQQRPRIVTSFLLSILITSLAWIHMTSPPPTRNLVKAAARLQSFAERNGTTLLLVDGNNLRGVAQDWDAVELQARVHTYCQKNGIHFSIVVWDHGSYPCVLPTTATSLILFSGLRQRADEVLVQEAGRLTASAAVVSDDVALIQRVQRTSAANRLNGECCITLDSTRFAELLRRQPDPMLSEREQQIQSELNHTKLQISKFKAQVRGGFRTRREVTWERVVLAETMRRWSSVSVQGGILSMPSFLKKYRHDLEARGYHSFTSVTIGNRAIVDPVAFVGPTRLERRQKRLLDRFNRMIWNGRLDQRMPRDR